MPFIIIYKYYYCVLLLHVVYPLLAAKPIYISSRLSVNHRVHHCGTFYVAHKSLTLSLSSANHVCLIDLFSQWVLCATDARVRKKNNINNDTMISFYASLWINIFAFIRFPLLMARQHAIRPSIQFGHTLDACIGVTCMPVVHMEKNVQWNAFDRFDFGSMSGIICIIYYSH